MKLGLITDIHGNISALESVLAALDHAGVDLILCAGDLVSYGGSDNEVISCIRDRTIPCVTGNYDYAVAWDQASASPRPSSPQTEPLKQAALDWSKTHCSQESRQYLQALPWRQQFVVDETSIEVIHAGPNSLVDWYTPEVPEAIDELTQSIDADVLLLGHTHQAFVNQANDTTVVNPGAVGRSLDGDTRACYALFDTRTSNASLHRVEYDIEHTLSIIRESEMPNEIATMIEQGIRRIEEAVYA